MTPQHATLELNIYGMDYPGCAKKLESALSMHIPVNPTKETDVMATGVPL
ncbi:MAG: hypothetical protein AB9919_06050 [Geobacteraceae bacterium]